MHFRAPRLLRGVASLDVLTAVVTLTTAGAVVAQPALLPQAMVPQNEPVLAAAVYVGMGLVLLWFAKLGIDLKAGVERLTLRVDDPNTGIVVTLEKHMNETRGALGHLSNELEDAKRKVEVTEATCAATHQRKVTGKGNSK